MRTYTRYRSRRARRPWLTAVSWLLSLSGLVLMGWVLWKTSLLTPPQGTPARPNFAPATNTTPPPPSTNGGLTQRETRGTDALAANRTLAPISTSGSATGRSAVMLAWQTNALTNMAVNHQVEEEELAGAGIKTVFDAQVALARRGISGGSLDGVMGSQTRAALRAYQRHNGLPVTGKLDAASRHRLTLEEPPVILYPVNGYDLGRLRPLSGTWLGKSQQDRLDYETVLELAAEKGHAHPALIRRLNPEVDWSKITPGQLIRIPAVDYPPVVNKAALVVIQLAEKSLEAFDSRTNLLAHFPVSIARQVEKRPVGQLRVERIIAGPNYTFNPEVFPESAEGRQLGRKLVLPPGPNNPVGTLWIGLDRPGYGIHGTPKPEEVGRTESHGCFRLANWNAEYLAKLVAVGTPVNVEP